MSKRRYQREEVIRQLQSRAPLKPEERPVVTIGPEGKLTPEQAAQYQGSWMPKSVEDIYLSAILTFNKALDGSVPAATTHLLGELKYKLDAAEYHLGKVSGGAISEWYEAEAFLNQARSALEILALVLHQHVKQLPRSFRNRGLPIANALRNQSADSPQYSTGTSLAECIEEAQFSATLTAVRDEIAHGPSFPTLAKAREEVVHLGGLDLDQFCIGIWLSLMTFTRTFLEHTITLGPEVRNGQPAPRIFRLTAPPGREDHPPRYVRRGTIDGVHRIDISYGNNG